MPLPFALKDLEAVSREAGRIAIESRKSLVRELKPDGSIVTNGDRAVETYLRPVLKELAPGSRVWGEEFGLEEGDGPLWVVDPVDGTSNYAYHSPIWGVSIGFVDRGKVRAGSIFLPDLQEMAIGEAGSLPTLNGKPMSPIPSGPVEAYELVGYCDQILRSTPSKPPGRMRCSGAFVWDGLSVPLQRLRGLVGMSERLYDVAPAVLFALELGGEVRYADGSAFVISDLMDGRQIPKPWIIFPMESGYFV